MLGQFPIALHLVEDPQDRELLGTVHLVDEEFAIQVINFVLDGLGN